MHREPHVPAGLQPLVGIAIANQNAMAIDQPVAEFSGSWPGRGQFGEKVIRGRGRYCEAKLHQRGAKLFAMPGVLAQRGCGKVTIPNSDSQRIHRHLHHGPCRQEIRYFAGGIRMCHCITDSERRTAIEFGERADNDQPFARRCFLYPRCVGHVVDESFVEQHRRASFQAVEKRPGGIVRVIENDHVATLRALRQVIHSLQRERDEFHALLGADSTVFAEGRHWR